MVIEFCLLVFPISLLLCGLFMAHAISRRKPEVELLWVAMNYWDDPSLFTERGLAARRRANICMWIFGVAFATSVVVTMVSRVVSHLS